MTRKASSSKEGELPLGTLPRRCTYVARQWSLFDVPNDMQKQEQHPRHPQPQLGCVVEPYSSQAPAEGPLKAECS